MSDVIGDDISLILISETRCICGPHLPDSSVLEGAKGKGASVRKRVEFKIPSMRRGEWSGL